MTVGKINQDLYIGTTGKQLKDIKTNADAIIKHNGRLKYLENVEWIYLYSSRKRKYLEAWKGTAIEDLLMDRGNISDYLEYSTAGVKIKNECTVAVFAQGSINVPILDCGIQIFLNSHRMAENYNRGNGVYTYLSTFAIIHCTKDDIIQLAYMCGQTGTYEYLENTSIYALVLK